MHPSPRRCVNLLVAAVVASLLASCAGLPPAFCIFSSKGCNRPAVDARLRKPCQTQSDYLRELALARLTPESPPKDTTNPLCTGSPQSIVLLEYKVKYKDSIREIAAPFDLRESSPDFSELEDILGKLQDKPYILEDVRLYMVQADKDILPARSPEALEDGWKTLLARAKRLPALEEARVDIALIRFFMNQRHRDAAYLTVDNAKQALARASREFPDQKERITAQSGELERLEHRLKQNMPFKL